MLGTATTTTKKVRQLTMLLLRPKKLFGADEGVQKTTTPLGQ
jgi:hypothetical protein